MSRKKSPLLSLATAGLVVAGLAVVWPALSQGQGGPPPGGFGGPPPGGFAQGGPGGGGPGGGRMPFAGGTVKSVDAGAGTLTVSGWNNSTQTIKVGANAQIVTQQTVSVSDLKVGDQIAVQGVPTGITASQATVGQPPAGLPGAGGGPGGPGGFGGQRAGNGNANNRPASSAMAQGTIKALPTTTDPHLTLSLGTDATLFLKMADGAKITKYATLTLDQVKAGDRVMASGQAGADGTFAATTVGVNLAQSMMGGRGGFGGPGGPGGPGGFAQGGPPPGGFGGPPPGGPQGGFEGPPPPGGFGPGQPGDGNNAPAGPNAGGNDE